MAPILYRRCRVPAGADGPAAFLVVDGRIAWSGPDGDRPECRRQVDLGGRLVTPAFVDAHVHATATGLALDGLDLAGAPSRSAVLDAVAAAAREQPRSVILGTGWDESGWDDPRPPTACELDRAAAGAAVYLARADVHSAIVSLTLMRCCPGLAAAAGYDPDGHQRRDAHHAVRAAALEAVSTAQRGAAQRRMLRHAASLGIGCVHEMAGPQVSGVDDLRDLLELARAGYGPDVVGYWGALGDVDTPRRLGVAAGGDLFCDGSIGSHTAALWADYADRPTRGHIYHDDAAVAEHVVACARAGLQTGFHAIGDRALAAVAGGLRKAAAVVGAEVIRAGRHRVEHAEMPEPEVISTFASLRVIASVQPAFDARWGAPGGMYERRLGPGRAAALNPLRDYQSAGVTLAFGSDSPVTPLDPWGGVRAAVCHHRVGARLSLPEAFAAATSGGWVAAGRSQPDQRGRLVTGAPATFAVWSSAAMPDLAGGEPPPDCLGTVVRGSEVWPVQTNMSKEG